ncbi:MucR family transcriptional regulator [Iodidimonas muriae]|uniref:MucR family transcriptional regulator n=1 Tax=Iodidimonas muriae TaxID=261467 RepID=A0ABQ2LHP1_9PROT|nr:MucR family transcriptional regulator [Kordiimonadales bacterium JCM 17843]GGO16293.1 MucR family transcriptional regulator [Iodidimonas muriae]
MIDSNKKNQQDSENLNRVADIVTAYISNNPVPPSQIPEIIASVHRSLHTLAHDAAAAQTEPQKPAVSPKKSITDDFIICLEDGKKLKMLKRYLRSKYNMTPDEYRAKWDLPADYPMVAPNYAKRRSEFAKQIGLGKSGRGGRKKR